MINIKNDSTEHTDITSHMKELFVKQENITKMFDYIAWVDNLEALVAKFWVEQFFELLPTEPHILVKTAFPLDHLQSKNENRRPEKRWRIENKPIIIASWNDGPCDL